VKRRDGALGPDASSLDTPDITRPRDHASESNRRAWLAQVERGTDAHRIGKAQLHTWLGEQLKAARLADGSPWEEAHSGLVWHHRRAVGHIERFERVYECGQEPFWLICCECGAARERHRVCRAGVLCLSCRGLIQEERRRKFKLGRERSVAAAGERGLFKLGRRRSWSEKFLTLTAPHCSEHSVRERIDLISAAWTLLLKSLNRFFLNKAGCHKDAVAWQRSFEWTPGGDGRGHPHFHVWMLCPYIKQQHIRVLWRSALRTVGYSRTSTHRVIVDIEAVKSPDGAARELLKYMTKDWLPDRSQVAPDVFARVYEALDGKRLVQSSSRFLADLDHRLRCECGAIGCFKRSSTPPDSNSGAASRKPAGDAADEEKGK
jgi:hypothetical protein